MINKISNWRSPFDLVEIKDNPIVHKVGYWKSVEIDNIIINYNEPLKPLTTRSIKMESR